MGLFSSEPSQSEKDAAFEQGRQDRDNADLVEGMQHLLIDSLTLPESRTELEKEYDRGYHHDK